ncbi:MAG: IS30 family transposase [Chlamydiales bacterium]
MERRKIASENKPKMTAIMTSTIEEKLALQWSPVQISVWLKKLGLVSVSHETIYQYIWKDKLNKGLLYKNLRHSGKKYNKRSKGMAGRGCIPNRIDIDERPLVVEGEVCLGDWGLDLIIGTEKSGAIVSMVDRASKLTKLIKVSRKSAQEVKEALIERLEPVKEFVLTLTSDNGKEFAKHQEISELLKAEFYFAKPYYSWERGLNEHANGLVRLYFPKSKRFDEISEEEVEKVELLLKNRPRKVLDFATPIEVFSYLREAA